MTIETALKVARMNAAEIFVAFLVNSEAGIARVRAEALTVLLADECERLQRRMEKIHALASHAERYHGDPFDVFTRVMELSRPTTGDAKPDAAPEKIRTI